MSFFGIGGDRTVTFGLFADEELTAADGSIFPADGLIEIIQLKVGGTVSFTTDIPFGKYYIRELQTAGPEYLPNDTKYPVNFGYQGQNIAVVDIKANSGEPILNELIYGNISGRKVDEAGEAVSGAVIGLFRADETEFTKENALMIDVSREDGAFGFENLVYGHWIVAEIEPPEGFILALEMHHVCRFRR